MVNGNVLVNDFIEEYEERLYERYKLYKTTDGRFGEKTNQAHRQWKLILKFIYDNKIDATFTLVQFRNIMEYMGSKLAYQDQDKDFAEYWSVITTMYYHINEQIARLLQ